MLENQLIQATRSFLMDSSKNKENISWSLTIIRNKNYDHHSMYILPVAPSPNLRTDGAIALYPSLCLFEATTVSIGRGTDMPFEVFGHPRFPKTGFSFTPMPTPGAKTPPQMNKLCNGYNLSNTTTKRKMKKWAKRKGTKAVCISIQV